MNNLTFHEIYNLIKGAETEIKKREEHIDQSKNSMNIAIEKNDLEWQQVIISNIEYDTEIICTLKSAIEKIKAIK